MKSSCSALDKMIREKMLGSQYYIDRIRLLVNDISALEPTQSLIRKFAKSVNGDIRADFEKTPKYIKKKASRQFVGFKINLHNPSMAFLGSLASILIKSHYSISWIEIAYDINTPSHDDAVRLLDSMSRMVVVPGVRNRPTFRDRVEKDLVNYDALAHSAYFGVYQDPRMFKMYIPKGDTKVFGNTSLHTEFRINGAEDIRRIGIYTLQDLTDFQVSRWYGQNLLIRGVNKKKVGELLRHSEDKTVASDKQCQKDFDRKFGPDRAAAHNVHHYQKGILREGLVDCGHKWLAGAAW